MGAEASKSSEVDGPTTTTSVGLEQAYERSNPQTAIKTEQVQSLQQQQQPPPQPGPPPPSHRIQQPPNDSSPVKHTSPTHATSAVPAVVVARPVVATPATITRAAVATPALATAAITPAQPMQAIVVASSVTPIATTSSTIVASVTRTPVPHQTVSTTIPATLVSKPIQPGPTQQYLTRVLEAETTPDAPHVHNVLTLKEQLLALQEVTQRHQQQQRETAERLRKELQSAGEPMALVEPTPPPQPQVPIDPIEAFIDAHRSKKPRTDGGPNPIPSNIAALQNTPSLSTALGAPSSNDFLPATPYPDEPMEACSIFIDPFTLPGQNAAAPYEPYNDPFLHPRPLEDAHQKFDPDQFWNDDNNITEMNEDDHGHPLPSITSDGVNSPIPQSTPTTSVYSEDSFGRYNPQSITLRGRVIENPADMSRIFLTNYLDLNLLGVVEKEYQHGHITSDVVKMNIMKLTTELDKDDQEELLAAFSRVNLNSDIAKSTSIIAQFTREPSPVPAQPTSSSSESEVTQVTGSGPIFRDDIVHFTDDLSPTQPLEDDPDMVARIRFTMVSSTPLFGLHTCPPSQPPLRPKCTLPPPFQHDPPLAHPQHHQHQPPHQPPGKNQHKRKKSDQAIPASPDLEEAQTSSSTDGQDPAETNPTPTTFPPVSREPLMVHRMIQINKAFERLMGFTQIECRESMRLLGQRGIFRYLRSDHIAACHKILVTWKMNHIPEGHMYQVRIAKGGHEVYCLTHFRVTHQHGVFVQGEQSIMPLPDDPLRPPPPFVPGFDLDVNTLLYGYGYKPPTPNDPTPTFTSSSASSASSSSFTPPDGLVDEILPAAQLDPQSPEYCLSSMTSL